MIYYLVPDLDGGYCLSHFYVVVPYISKNPGLRYDLAELTMADNLSLRCNARPALYGIFQHSGVHNATSRSTPSLCYRTQRTSFSYISVVTSSLSACSFSTPALTHRLSQCLYPLPVSGNVLLLAPPSTIPLLLSWLCQHFAYLSPAHNAPLHVMTLPTLSLLLSLLQRSAPWHGFANAYPSSLSLTTSCSLSWLCQRLAFLSVVYNALLISVFVRNASLASFTHSIFLQPVIAVNSPFH